VFQFGFLVVAALAGRDLGKVASVLRQDELLRKDVVPVSRLGF
jgi:hypothetical protein